MADYSSIGKKTSQSLTDIYKTTQQNSLDVTSIVNQSNNIRTSKRKAALNANKLLHEKGFTAYANKQEADATQKTNEQINKIEAGATQMAGIAGAAGAIGAGTLMFKENRQRAKEDAILKAENAKYRKERIAAINASTKANNAMIDAVNQQTRAIEESLKTVGGSSTLPTNVQAITPSGGTIDRQEVYTYLTKDKGLSHNKAYGLMANIDRESGFVPTIASGDDGGPGGLFQWKGSRQTPQVAALVKAGDWKGQIDYALSEPGEASTSGFLNTTWDSPQQAAAYWTRKWERPALPDKDVQKNNQFIAGYTYK